MKPLFTLVPVEGHAHHIHTFCVHVPAHTFHMMHYEIEHRSHVCMIYSLHFYSIP